MQYLLKDFDVDKVLITRWPHLVVIVLACAAIFAALFINFLILILAAGLLLLEALLLSYGYKKVYYSLVLCDKLPKEYIAANAYGDHYLVIIKREE